MGPLEIFFTAIGVTIAFVGLARGYKKELGTTLLILVAIFVLTFFEEQLINFFTSASGQLDFVIGSENQDANLFLMLLFQIVFISIVFASYAGRTLHFPGTEAPPPQGTLISLAVGALNGYLVAGTLWYYLDRFNYPVQAWGWVQLPLTATGQAVIAYLPQNVFDSPAYWMLPVAALLIMRVRG